MRNVIACCVLEISLVLAMTYYEALVTCSLKLHTKSVCKTTR